MPDPHDSNAMEEAPSKSALKRRMTALQQLGESLAQLGEAELAGMPIQDQRLLDAIREVRSIRSNSARRRHMQLIGKLMRDIDPAPLEAAMAARHRVQREQAQRFHQLEQLRDQLLSEGDTAIGTLLERWPQADRQLLRQLLRQHRKETANGQAPAASRKLFRYLRELQDT